MEIKTIEGFEDYQITSKGYIISNKTTTPKILKTYIDSKGCYECIKLSKGNKTYHLSIHRVVAMHFIPNPNNHPEVDHIDNNPRNNNVENLRWVDRQFNVNRQYERYSPTRFFKNCSLLYYGEFISDFDTILDACKYANKHYGASISMLQKYKNNKNCEIIEKM